jgi:hypothetical protein
MTNEGSLVDSDQKSNKWLNRTDILDKITYIILGYSIVAIIICMVIVLFTRNEHLLIDVGLLLVNIDAFIFLIGILISLRVYDYPLRYLIEG